MSSKSEKDNINTRMVSMVVYLKILHGKVFIGCLIFREYYW